jgi:hypothetical protein
MSVSEIVSIASSNVEFYESFQNKDFYYERIIDKTILLSSYVKDKLQQIVYIDFEIETYNDTIKSIEKNIKSLKEDLNYEYLSQFKFIVINHCIKINRQMRRETIDIIHSLHNLKNDNYKEIHVTEEIIKPSFSTHRTICESNKLRTILRNNNNKSYLMNMTNETRNKRKNNREMNKLLFQKIKSPKKYNKVRKTKSPNNKLYY